MTTQAPLAGRDTGRGGGNNKPPAAPSDPSRQHRAAATTAGVLFITGTAAGVLSKLVISRVHDAADPLTFASTHQGTVVTGALLVLLMGLSLAFVPVVLLPILRPVNEVLALGYLVIRGAVETTCYVLVAVAWLLLVPMDTVVQGPAGRRVRLGDLLINTDATNVVVALVFCLGAGLFYVLLYRSRIVPRWISVWGLASIPSYVAADLLVMYGVFDTDSTTQMLLSFPMFLQEMVLAVWMIARGFRPVVAGGLAEGEATGSRLPVAAGR